MPTSSTKPTAAKAAPSRAVAPAPPPRKPDTEVSKDPVADLIGTNPPVEPGVIPSPPAPPSAWTPATVVTYVSSLALFVIGVLTMAGVTVPASVSTQVQAWAGIAAAAVGALTPLWVLLSKHSVQKTALRQGVAPETAMRL